jgi:hypothetical protein
MKEVDFDKVIDRRVGIQGVDFDKVFMVKGAEG